MTYYQTEFIRIRQLVYPNQQQLDGVIGLKRFMDSNFDQDLNLDALAEAGFVSKFHLLRLFKRYYGQTPMQYLTGIRIERAKELLKSGMPVTQTCFAVGFESPASFSTLFKRRVGQTPLAYQKSNFRKV
ncbi:helix-turn-helix domain-containing protein [Pedobacter faecalis]|uniref:helix-turn-helix domain-containing protein n=1 Tax=Pedobacter faecalis TaxID=3041495 RepID=UPI00254F645D|nr:AraC family transcriptional regulator [Pedobacter sp. ELA7]